jgi:hypothetical protein
MNSTRIEVPVTLPAPHFDDERTIVTARQVKPIGRARVTENWRKVRTLFPLILLATFCGALGAVGVNYYDSRHRVEVVAQPAANNWGGQSKPEPSPIAIAASANPTPSVSDKANEATAAEVKTEAGNTDEKQTKIVTQPVRAEPSDKPAANSEKKTADADAAKLTRKRRVNSPDDEPTSANKKGAGRIGDIFSGPNPF